MTARVLQGDVFEMLPTIPAGSVDCCVCSPPYWKLRSYLPKGHPLKHLEIGNEPTPREYVEKMVRVFRLVRECMAEHATCWINIGDTYSVGGRGGNRMDCGPHANGSVGVRSPAGNGSLCLIPQRLAIALQDDGWLVRSVVVWHKPAPMPSSVAGWAWRRCRLKVKSVPGDRTNGQQHRRPHGETIRDSDNAQWSDCPGCPKCIPHGGYVLRRGSWRPTSSWEPILMLAKSAKYFCDGEAVKTPSASDSGWSKQRAKGINTWDYGRNGYEEQRIGGMSGQESLVDGTANLRDVWRAPDLESLSKDELIGLIQSMDDGSLPDTWTIAAEPLKEKHYAAYPTELVLRCLKAGTSAKGYCPTCGKPWARVVEKVDTGRKQKMADGWDTGPGSHGSIHRNGRQAGDQGVPVMEDKTLGWRPSCSHTAEPRPGLVLDPFSGSGRTALAAAKLGLDFVGVELNPDYVAMSERIIREDCPLFA